MILIKKTTNTVNDIIGIWLNSKNKIKIQSYQRYERLINRHISNRIGQYKLKKITELDIKKIF